MEQLIKKMAQDDVWRSWVAANSAGQDPRTAKNGCISAAPKAGCISAAPKSGCIS
ncbi:hypothetical protein [Streptomyces noursei]|uniref:hypothetical protein n=1 Tax=Streptomyces noursei TaxID=1971 RepID=UPI0035D576CD